MLCLARLIRCAIVASGTRNALRDLGGRQAADGAQRQRDRGRRRERRVAAHEEQHERVVALDAGSSDRPAATCCSGGTRLTTMCLAAAARGLAADVIGHAPRRDLDQPAARVVGHAVARPLRRRGDQRLLHRVLARRRSRGTGGSPRRAPAARGRAAGARRGGPATGASQQILRAARSSPGAPRSPC